MSHRQLIQRKTLPPGLQDPRACGSSETESRDGEFGDGEEACVVCYCTDDDEGAVSRGELLAGAAGAEHAQAGEGHGRAVDAGHEEAAENDFVEGRVGTACISCISIVRHGEAVCGAGGEKSCIDRCTED